MEIWERVRAKDPSLPLELSHREALLSLTATDNYVAAYTAVADYDFAGALSRIRVPVLILSGGRDSLDSCVGPTAELLQHTSCTVVRLPEEAGTYACDTHPQQVADAVANWLVDLDSEFRP